MVPMVQASSPGRSTAPWRRPGPSVSLSKASPWILAPWQPGEGRGLNLGGADGVERRRRRRGDDDTEEEQKRRGPARKGAIALAARRRRGSRHGRGRHENQRGGGGGEPAAAGDATRTNEEAAEGKSRRPRGATRGPATATPCLSRHPPDLREDGKDLDS
ncbi:unnamed protein product, partial [Urochloa humidicola]